VPLIPGLIIASGLGASFIQSLYERAINQFEFSSLAISNILTYSIILAIGLAQVVDLPRVAESADHRYGIYRSVGKWLNTFTPPDATVGALEVGIIGYFSQRDVIDFAGLIQPDVARVMGEDATYKDTTLYAIDEYHPEYIVLYSGHYPHIEQYLEDQMCQVSQFFPKENFGSSFDLVIYSCPW
ncbi:MAG: hypothetical protein GWN61_15905, partial [candidate division Zixibacteria bacterium]|nr:hypothetical protein [candidate division Zixibacteria bacterium]NIW46832.1 hypothetical protein [Gammaproteobacteria bacterium]NIR65731.1 hypothetical protein [candidate division Zixibacteria bacterium]NIS47416.1 hypothetical protein [candidate division Zixibacteria bacterium]NIU15514.1 hypothetical protein [candidate division Zixibacteria bacterium]